MCSPVNLSLGSTRTHPPFRLIWDWCGLSEDEEDALDLKPFRRRSLSRTHHKPNGINAYLNCSTCSSSPTITPLVYILASFSQVAMVHEENRKISRVCSDDGYLEVDNPDNENLLLKSLWKILISREWKGRRWSSISEGLLDVVEDAKMGVFRDQHHETPMP